MISRREAIAHREMMLGDPPPRPRWRILACLWVAVVCGTLGGCSLDHAITVRDLVHYTLFVSFIVSLLIAVYLWLLALFSFSDVPSDGVPTWLFVCANLLPVALFIAWWVI